MGAAACSDIQPAAAAISPCIRVGKAPVRRGRSKQALVNEAVTVEVGGEPAADDANETKTIVPTVAHLGATPIGPDTLAIASGIALDAEIIPQSPAPSSRGSVTGGSASSFATASDDEQYANSEKTERDDIQSEASDDSVVEPTGWLRDLLNVGNFATQDAAKLRSELESLDEGIVASGFAAARRRATTRGSRPQKLHLPRALLWNRKHTPNLHRGASVSDKASAPRHVAEKWWRAGLEMLAGQKVAVVLVVGGGGHTGESCRHILEDLGLPSRKSLLQLLCERLRRLLHLAERMLAIKAQKKHRSQKAKVRWPLYLFATADLRPSIEKHLMDGWYFGLDPTWVRFVIQPCDPVLDASGRVCLAGHDRLARAPAGAGSLLRVFQEEKIYEDMGRHGIEYLYVTSCNNLLELLADPAFVGMVSMLSAPCGVKVVDRLGRSDGIGVLCTGFRDGEHHAPFPQVLQQADIHQEHLHLKAKDGKPRLRMGDVEHYILSVSLCVRAASLPRPFPPPRSLPVKLRAFDPEAERFRDFGPGCDIEAFAFKSMISDAFACADRVAGLRADRVAEFAPLTGDGTIEKAVASLSFLHQFWVEAVGGMFHGGLPGSLEDEEFTAQPHRSLCEVSPLVSYAGEDLEGHFHGYLDLPLHVNARDEPACKLTMKANRNSRSGTGAIPVPVDEAFAEICDADEMLPPTPPEVEDKPEGFGGRE